MAQVQCPNCGGYKVETKATVKIDPESGHQVIEGAKSCLLLLFVFLLGPLGALFLFSAALASDQPISAVVFGALGIIGLVPTIIITAGIIKTIKREGGIKKGQKTVKKYYYACHLCGYEWSRREDEPLPPVTLRPDLILKGEQRLREEAEEWARRAAAAQWIQRQQRKK